MLKHPQFWEEEKDAPLLGLNNGFLKPDDSTIFERTESPACVSGKSLDEIIEQVRNSGGSISRGLQKALSA